MERRRHPRAEVRLEVDIEWDGRRGPALILDISRGGVLLASPLLRPPGVPEALRLHFGIWTGQRLLTRQVEARRVREAGAGVAYAFDTGDPLSQAVVSELLHYHACQQPPAADIA